MSALYKGIAYRKFICIIFYHFPNHPYNSVTAGRASGREVFLEFWDVGGSTGTRNSRSIFYSNADGLIVVHDLSNRKSFLNLQDWVQEALNSARQEFTGITVASPTPSPSSSMNSSTTGF